MKMMTRRQFVKRSAAGAGLIIGVSWLENGITLWAAPEAAPAGASINAWIQIFPNEDVLIEVSKSEMGQGIYTSLPMIVADELDADWKKVRIEAAPAKEKYKDKLFGMQATGGSTSVRHLHDVMRAAGAAGREMLVAAASREWGVPAQSCRAERGFVIHSKSNRKASYGQLSAKAAALPLPEKPVLKEKNELRLIGKEWPRIDMEEKSTGRAKFGIDTFLPGMLYGSIARPHAYGAKVVSFNGSAAEAVSGVRGVYQLESGIGVVADTLDAAWKGRKVLNVRWSAGTHPEWSTEQLEKLLAGSLSKEGVSARNDGDAAKALAGAAKKLDVNYRLPYVYHATMEPMNCTADVRKDGCDIYVPTQNQTGTQAAGAAICGLPLEKVRVHTTYLGGGFGRRFEMDFVRDAVLLSKSSGKPVKLIYTREEDMKNDFYRPGSHCRIQGGLDSSGRVVAYSHKTAVSSIFARVFPSMIKDGIDHSAVEGIFDTPYEIPNMSVAWVPVETPVPVGFWRSVGNSSNGFTVESFIDELAHAAGKDPLEFRLAMLKKQARPHDLLKFVAEKAGWGSSLPEGRGRGIAQHFSFGSYVATVAEASVDKTDGTVTVHRIVCAADCGPIVNLDTAIAQLEGGSLMGMSAAMKEEIVFGTGGVKSENYDTYDLLRINEAPDVEAYIKPSEAALGGLGEPAVPPVGPAIANAVFAASGIRVRRLPMTPENVLAAIGK